MEKKNIPDKMIVPVMLKHNITREEAEARIQLLFQSSILETGHPSDPETQKMIDDFLSEDSSALAEKVAFDQCLTACLSNKELIANYDRLSGSNFSKIMKDAKQGKESKKSYKEFQKFAQFVRETVFAAWSASLNTTP